MDLHWQRLSEAFGEFSSVVEIRRHIVVAVLHVAVLARLRPAGWNVRMQITPVECGALYRCFKLQVRAQSMTLTAHQ